MLTNEQKKAIEKFKKLKVGALFMKQGTGKTRAALELVNSTDTDILLIVCPYIAKENINKEVKRWGVHCQYLIVGYETISASDNTYIDILNYIKGKKTFIIADESIFIKNENTKRFKRMIEISKKSEYRLILNGTPITKNEWDIYNQMYFLSPLIIDMDRDTFLKTFFKHIRYKKRGQRERDFYKLSEVNLEYLQKLIAPYIYECDFDFEKNIEIKNICIPASVETQQKYYKRKEHLLEMLSIGECRVDMFTNLAITCFIDQERHRRIAKQLKGQIIVFCTLLEEVKNISRIIDCYVITGATKNREDILESFKNDNKPLLITFGTGAFSLNLQFCNRVAFSSIVFDYAKIDQAMSRIKRIGQDRDIEYIFFTSDLGIYSMIRENVNRKKTLKEMIIEKIERGESFEECI